MIEIKQNISINACVICPLLSGDVSVSAESRLAEAVGLALAIKLNVVYQEALRLKEVKSAMFFSRGFTQRMLPIIAEYSIGLLIVDGHLSPIQQRNLERELKIKVIDRTALILEIFGERAQTREGVLQVELAHLTYQRSRLVRSWTHLERQRGGAGFLGGPGETQIELDRRVIDDKIIRIRKELSKVKQTRDIQRGARRKVPYPVVALVGYTNAGKSTLFNYLTQSQVMAQDMLFATLDPTMRKLILPTGKEVILSDTVGFISDLPHELVMAFRATLEEVLCADLILHVRDIANPDTAKQRADVLQVLANLGLNEIQYADNYIEVFNKADLLPQEEVLSWKNKNKFNPNIVLTSALNGQGIIELLRLIADKLTAMHKKYEVRFFAGDGQTASWLHNNAQVEKMQSLDDELVYSVLMDDDNLARLQNKSLNNPQIKITQK